MPRSSFTSIAKILPKAARKSGITEGVTAALALEAAAEAWGERNPAAAAMTTWRSLKEGMLKVTVTHPAAWYLLRLHRSWVIAQVNKRLKRKMVKAIVLIAP